MSRLTFGFVENIAPDDAKVLTDGLLAHADQAGFTERPHNLAILVRDDTGVIRAGLMGNTNHRECYINVVWAQDSERAKGLGRKLMGMAEAEATRRGCRVINLFSMSYGAPGFYAKLGYSELGRVEGLGDQHNLTRFWLGKKLAEQSS